jgi:dihydrofolate reductase
MTRNLVLQMAVSLDGFVARADNSLDWGPTSPDLEHYDWIYELLEGAGTHIMGRRAYEDMSPYWPTSDDKMAPRMNDTPKVVFSKTLPSASWTGTRIARGDLVEEIIALKAEDGGEIVAHGGARFVQSLSRHGLVDEYRLSVRPVALGAGLPMFANQVYLRLVSSRPFPTGVVLNTCRP